MKTKANTKKSSTVIGEFTTEVKYACGCKKKFATLGYKPNLAEIRKSNNCPHCIMKNLMGTQYGAII